MTLNDEYAKLLLFFNWAMQESFEGNDLDVGSVQSKAIELGLAKEEPYDPQRHGVATHCEEGDAWIRLTVERYGVPPLPRPDTQSARVRGGEVNGRNKT